VGVVAVSLEKLDDVGVNVGVRSDVGLPLLELDLGGEFAL
jgi:hypothetical protein